MGGLQPDELVAKSSGWPARSRAQLRLRNLRAFTPLGSLKHLPLLTGGDQWDAQRNLVQWINYCVRATVAAKLLDGNPSGI